MLIKTLTKSAVCVFLLSIAFAAGVPAKVSVAAKAQPAPIAYFYDSPEVAVKALFSALKANDKAELLKILGPGAGEVLESGDAVADNAERATFIAAYEEKNMLVPGREGKANQRILEVGANNWPFPIPLVADKKSGLWYFDGKAGREEILDRRVGRNEHSTIQVIQAYVDAQREYYQLNPDKAVIPHFAQKIASSPGKRDGLYWETKAGEPPSPLGALVAEAATDGYKPVQQDNKQGESKSYYGYRYQILSGQGKHAPKGAYEYVENDLMFGGFALVAYPAVYGVSGVMTFIVNQDGVIYEKNLGKNTTTLAQKITHFDPDKTWRKVEQ